MTTMLLVLAGSTVHAKGLPDKAIIRGGSLAQPIEITDRETLMLFSPWFDKFIDWEKGVVAAPATQEQVFEVSIFMKSRPDNPAQDHRDMRLIYTLKYCPRTSGPGYIYLPGKDDEHYAVNVSTILRDGHDGKWHQAATAWETVVKRLIASSTSSQPQNRSVTGGSALGTGNLQRGALLVIGFTLALGVVVAHRRKRRKSFEVNA